MDSTGHLCTAAVGSWLLSSVLAFFQKARPLKEGKKVVSERNRRRIALQQATKDEQGSHNDHNQSDEKQEQNDKDEHGVP
jgi:hypothetical protein